MKFEEKLVLQRKRQGLSQEELAARIGVSRQAVSRWELGSTMPDAPNLVKLADLFGVTTDYLLRETEEAPSPAPAPEEIRVEAPEVTRGKKSGEGLLFSSVCYLLATLCFFIAAAIRADAYSWLNIVAGCMTLVAGCGMLKKYQDAGRKTDER